MSSRLASRARGLRTLLGPPAEQSDAFDDIKDIRARRALAVIGMSHPAQTADLANAIRRLQAEATPASDTAIPTTDECP